MRRLLLALAFVSVTSILFVSTAPQAASQAAVKGLAPTDELIETADGVKLRGLFYRAAVNKNGSCVIIAHQLLKDPTKGDWDGLAKRLSAEGYHVLRFDFRGHGKSTELIPEKFWQDPLNSTRLSGAKKNPPKRELVQKDIEGKSSYYPQMVYDFAAARNHLDKLNDSGDVNSSSVYLIGAGETTPIGFLFLASEWHREQKKPVGLLGIQKLVITAYGQIAQGSSPAGRDYGGCIWLSPAQHSSVSSTALKNLVATVGRHTDGDMRKETPMLFIHGEKDKKGDTDAKYFVDQVMVASGKTGARLEKLDHTYLRTIKGTDLKGVDLLGKDEQLGTEKMIVEFLTTMEGIRRKKPRITREYTDPLKIDVRSFGVGQ
jgi:pimeloyl-ACP methyl ester carboxylesterase